MKLLLVTVVLVLLVTTALACILRETVGKSHPLSLICAIVIAVLIAMTSAAQFVGSIAVVTVIFLAISEK